MTVGPVCNDEGGAPVGDPTPTVKPGAVIRAANPEAATSRHHLGFVGRTKTLVRAIEDGDDSKVEKAVLDLSRSRRLFAPLAFLVGAFVMLFQGVKLLFSNWRLTLVEVLPAMWIWLALLDLKVHLLHGKSFTVLRGPILIPIILAIAAITAASFLLNAVFAFAIALPGSPDIRRGFTKARSHLRVVLGWGLLIGLCLGISTTVLPRWGRWWFVVSLSIIIGVMMVAYVSVPSRLIGLAKAGSRRDQVSASAIGGSIGAVVCTPPYVLGRNWRSDARLPRAFRSRHLRPRPRCHTSGRCERRRKGDQNERQVGFRSEHRDLTQSRVFAGGLDDA